MEHTFIQADCVGMKALLVVATGWVGAMGGLAYGACHSRPLEQAAA